MRQQRLFLVRVKEHGRSPYFTQSHFLKDVKARRFDDAMEAWQKTPTLKFRSGGLLHKIDQL